MADDGNLAFDANGQNGLEGSKTRVTQERPQDEHRTSHEDAQYASCMSTYPDPTHGSSRENNAGNHCQSTSSGFPQKSIQSMQRSATSFPMDHNHVSVVKHLARLTLDPQSSHTEGKDSKKDGRLKLHVNEKVNSEVLARLLGTSLKQHLTLPGLSEHSRPDQASTSARPPVEHAQPKGEPANIPRLNIVIMVIGSRGDIQPFVKIGKTLKEKYDHRVRIATHPAFKDFVERDAGLEHFSVGGSPSELMSFMVKNPGLIPSFDTLRKGEIGRRREQMAEMFEGFWHACVTDSAATNDNFGGPFVADAIIANPPSFAHVHCAERLGVPLHIMFTFPYTPTTKFPHPLANIKEANMNESYTNFMSYPLVELMTWQGLGDLVNRFRVKTLGLDPVSTVWITCNLYRLRVPFSYLWSPGLIAKPSDWGSEIDISGFVFLDLASSFTPPDDLEKFLAAEEAPIYIGFGSIVVDDPAKFTALIFHAVKLAGVRAVISKGWGGFGANAEIPSNIFMLDNVPHDWLFQKTKAVVHHGGAGTTAIGLKLAKPTFIVPFFGDQPFWGSMVAASGAGQCVPYKQLTPEKLAEGIKYCFSAEAQDSVRKVADCIARDGDGAENAVKSFHAMLPLQGANPMRCSVLENRVATWQLKRSNLRLSPLAAELLVQKGQLNYEQMSLRRQYAWTDFQGSGGPVTGGISAIVGSITGVGKSIGDGPIAASKDIDKRVKHEKKKVRHMKREREREMSLESRGGPTEIATLDAEPARSAQFEQHNSDTKNSQPSLPQEEEDWQRRSASMAGDLSLYQPRRQETNISALSEDPSENIVTTVTRDVARGMKDPAEAAAKFPMDLFVGVTNGFHNAPRLYGDKTVRRPERIQGLRSGVKAGGNEFAYGMYDAISGVVSQPIKGAKEEGPVGFAAGIGKGIGGLVLKQCAAVTAPISYTMQGLYKEATKSRTPIAQIRQARESQGQMEIARLDDDKRERALQAAGKGWAFMNDLWKKGEMVKRGELSTGGQRLPENPAWAGGKVVAGLKGRYGYEKKKKELERTGAFENVDKTHEAMAESLAGKEDDIGAR